MRESKEGRAAAGGGGANPRSLQSIGSLSVMPALQAFETAGRATSGSRRGAELVAEGR